MYRRIDDAAIIERNEGNRRMSAPIAGGCLFLSTHGQRLHASNASLSEWQVKECHVAQASMEGLLFLSLVKSRG